SLAAALATIEPGRILCGFGTRLNLIASAAEIAALGPGQELQRTRVHHGTETLLGRARQVLRADLAHRPILAMTIERQELDRAAASLLACSPSEHRRCACRPCVDHAQPLHRAMRAVFMCAWCDNYRRFARRRH